jgi:Na+-transporting methylmalonyl-CoA/oxaloacetate decarboxylase gamma subunit
MSTPQPAATSLDEQPIPVRATLAAAWTSFMFLYAYVDILGFYTPGVVDDILDGKVYEFDLSQTFSTTVLAVLAIPMFMIVLSATLPARANRITNLVVAAVLVPFTVFNVAGGFYLYFYGLGVVLELVVLALVVRYAWTWPRTAPSAAATSTTSTTTHPDRETVRAQHV